MDESLHLKACLTTLWLVPPQVLSEGDKLKVMILSQDRERGRVTLSTKKLEPTPGDMLRDPQKVFEKAEEVRRGEGGEAAEQRWTSHRAACRQRS